MFKIGDAFKIGELLDTVVVVGELSYDLAKKFEDLGACVERVPNVMHIDTFINSMRGKDYEIVIFTDAQVPLNVMTHVNRYARVLHTGGERMDAITIIQDHIFDRYVGHIREAAMTHDYKCNFLSYNIKHSDQSLIDVSCGRGVYLRHWRDMGLRVSGTELSAKNCYYVQRHGMNCFKTDLDEVGVRLPWIDNGVDVVTCTEVIEHLKDPKKVVAEMMRISKRLVLITTPVGDSYDAPDHIHHYWDEQELRNAIIPEWVTGRDVSIHRVVTKPEDWPRQQRAFVVRIEV